MFLFPSDKFEKQIHLKLVAPHLSTAFTRTLSHNCSCIQRQFTITLTFFSYKCLYVSMDIYIHNWYICTCIYFIYMYLFIWYVKTNRKSFCILSLWNDCSTLVYLKDGRWCNSKIVWQDLSKLKNEGDSFLVN